MNNKILVSILIPSRKRFDLLKTSINSIIQRATHPLKIEILVRLDIDDIESIKRIPELNELTPNFKVIIGPQLNGYKSVHNFYNELGKIATGKFYWLWNDDALLETEKWDKIILPYINKPCILQISNNHNWVVFPMVHHSIYKTLGHFSLSTQTDTWLHHITEVAGMEKYLTEIFATHNRADLTGLNADETFDGGYGDLENYLLYEKELYSCALTRERVNDINKLLTLREEYSNVSYPIFR